MIFSIISFVLVFGSGDQCPICCDTINPQYRYSCCHNKLCSECWAKMKDNDISKCAFCHIDTSVEPVPNWSGEETKTPKLTKEENQKLNEKLIQKNKYDSQQDLQTKQMLSKLAMEEDDELGKQFAEAAENGNLEQFKIFHADQFNTRIPDKYFDEAWVAAALGNHLEILK